MELKNKVVVITGGSAGIGRAAARLFAKEGCKVAVIARGKDRLDDTVKEIEKLGGKGLGIHADVADYNQVFAAASRVENQLGPVDIWINDAMVSVFSPIKEMRPEEFKRVTEVTYLGFVYGTLAALKYMIPRDRGTIIQVGSALSYRSIPLQSAYCAAKHAINGFTEALLTELHHDRSHIKVCMVQMPAVNTPQFDWEKSRLPRRTRPAGTIYQPEVAASGILHVAKHPRRQLSVGASTVFVETMEKFFAGLIDWYMSLTLYKGQMTKEADNHESRYNLWMPVPGHQAAHGRFDKQAHDFSLQLWMNTHRKTLAMMGLGLGATLVASRKAAERRLGV